MPDLLSNWKLTLDHAVSPVVLLDYDVEIADEVSWDAERDMELTPLVRSNAPALDDLGNGFVTISFTRHDDAASDAAARQALMVALLAALTGSVKTLKVEVSGVTDRYWLFAEALLHRPNHVRDAGGVAGRRSTAYRITAADMSEVIIP